MANSITTIISCQF